MQNARTRERMGALLSKAKQLQQPAAPPAAAPAEGADDAAAPEATEQQQPPAMSAAEKLAVGEEFLKQLGARPLAAALGDLYKLLDAQAGADSKPEVRCMPGLDHVYLICEFALFVVWLLQDGAWHVVTTK
jgi:hypothetical protein